MEDSSNGFVTIYHQIDVQQASYLVDCLKMLTPKPVVELYSMVNSICLLYPYVLMVMIYSPQSSSKVPNVGLTVCNT